MTRFEVELVITVDGNLPDIIMHVEVESNELDFHGDVYNKALARARAILKPGADIFINGCKQV